MTKKEVEDKKLRAYVLHPGLDNLDLIMSDWWKDLCHHDEVEVKYPHERHGLAGKPSNKSKPAMRDAFLQFVDNNSHPNAGKQVATALSFIYPQIHKNRTT